MIIVLVSIHYRVRTYDGYTVLIYTGIVNNYLVIEGIVQDYGRDRHMYGVLPNKKQVWIGISAWDGSVKMGIGDKGDEKNIV